MTRSPNLLTAKLESFLAFQRRVVGDFQRSLDNAAHFIALAGKSMEREPENTVHMVNQIQDIGLLSHLEDQFQEFQQMAAMLTAMPGGVGRDDLEDGIDELKNQYEVLLAQAEEQAERLAEIVNTLERPH